MRHNESENQFNNLNRGDFVRLNGDLFTFRRFDNGCFLFERSFGEDAGNEVWLSWDAEERDWQNEGNGNLVEVELQ